MKKIILLALLPLFSLGQQHEIIKQDGDTQNGKGEIIILFEDGTEQSMIGTFQNGQLEGQDGEIKVTNQEFTRVYIGLFKQGDLIKGKIEYQEGKYRKISSGFFKNNKLHGPTCKVEINFKDGDIQIEEGRFINGSLIDGSHLYKWANGKQQICQYNDGEEIDCIRNDRNHYNANDVIGGSSSKIMLQTLNDQAFIEIGFGNTKTNIKWDTGAFGLALSNHDFKKLIESGVEFMDLNLKTVSYGVANIPLEGQTLIINNLKIGEYILNNVVCNYYPNFERSLIGMNFFDKFSNVKWDKKNEFLILYK